MYEQNNEKPSENEIDSEEEAETKEVEQSDMELGTGAEAGAKAGGGFTDDEDGVSGLDRDDDIDRINLVSFQAEDGNVKKKSFVQNLIQIQISIRWLICRAGLWKESTFS